MSGQARSAAQAGGKPKASRFRDWTAILHMEPKEQLRVSGEFRLKRGSGSASLRKARAQPDPTMLILNVVERKGIGGRWKAVSGNFAAQEGRYSHVTLRAGDGEELKVHVQVQPGPI